MIATTPSISFVWGSSVPLPPDLAPGWCYHADPHDWLLVERLSDGSLWFVICNEGEYELWPRVAVQRGALRENVGDRDAAIPLPTLAGGVSKSAFGDRWGFAVARVFCGKIARRAA